MARALATKAAMSSEADGFASGNEPVLPDASADTAEMSPSGFGLVGSRDMFARKWLQAYVALVGESVNAPNLIRMMNPNR
jgi:hypothetical protein